MSTKSKVKRKSLACGRLRAGARLRVGARAGLQQVAALAQPHRQAHDQALAQRVDRRVGHLPLAAQFGTSSYCWRLIAGSMSPRLNLVQHWYA